MSACQCSRRENIFRAGRNWTVNQILQLIEALRDRPVSSRAELQEATGLSPASISRAWAQRRRDGLVSESAAADAGVGRPPQVVRFQPSAAHVIGIDAGGSRIRVLITDLEGNELARSAVRVRTTSRAIPLVRSIADVVERLVGDSNANPVSAAAGISGIVDAANGTVLLSPDLPGLNGSPVADLLSKELGMPAAVDNDDLLAAAGEAAFGAAKDCRDVVFLSLGLGLGAGLLVGGRPVRGARSSAGAIAYFAPDRLEDRASGRAIPRRYADRVNERSAKPPRRTARRIFELADAGDEIARGVVVEALGALTDLVVNVAALLDPEVIVVGGGIARGRPTLVGDLAERVRETLPFPPRLVRSQLGEDVVARGAASLALTLGQRRLAGVAVEPGRLGALEFV
jgi:predicted NBD/HSP70 family sugar kinase